MESCYYEIAPLDKTCYAECIPNEFLQEEKDRKEQLKIYSRILDRKARVNHHAKREPKAPNHWNRTRSNPRLR